MSTAAGADPAQVAAGLGLGGGEAADAVLEQGEEPVLLLGRPEEPQRDGRAEVLEHLGGGGIHPGDVLGQDHPLRRPRLGAAVLLRRHERQPAQLPVELDEVVGEPVVVLHPGADRSDPLLGHPPDGLREQLLLRAEDRHSHPRLITRSAGP